MIYKGIANQTIVMNVFFINVIICLGAFMFNPCSEGMILTSTDAPRTVKNKAFVTAVDP